MYTHLVSTETLADHLEDPSWVVVDCRFDLAQPDWGFADYQRAHIPGAAYAHLDKDLSSPITPETGRHPLPSPEQFRAQMERLGIAPGTQVVAYDTTGGSFAGRLWFLLRLFDHPEVALLDGGFTQWLKEGRPAASGIETRAPVQRPEPLTVRTEMLVSADEVERIRQDPAYQLIDARTPERFRGEVEPIDTVAGHIPGAVNRFHGENLQPDGTVKPPSELQADFQALLAGTPPERTVLYCGSGVTSCHHLLAMEAAGLPGAKVYVGSWSEWIRDPRRPRSTPPGKKST